MKKLKLKLKIIGLLVILLGGLCSGILPGFSKPSRSSLSKEKRIQISVDNQRWTFIHVMVSSACFGAGLALLVAGYSIKENK